MDTNTVHSVGVVKRETREVTDEQLEGLRRGTARVAIFEEFEKALYNFEERVGIGERRLGTDTSHRNKSSTNSAGLIDVIFLFDTVSDEDIILSGPSRHGLTASGEGGVFTRRTPKRPNRLGSTTVRVIGIEGRVLEVEGLDAVDGTPILDIKPYVDWRTLL